MMPCSLRCRIAGLLLAMVTVVLLAAVVTVALWAGVPAAHADMLLRQAVHSEPYRMRADQAPAPYDTVSIWLGADRAAISGGGTDGILRRDESKFYLLNHRTSSYSVVPLPCDLWEFFPPGHANRQAFQQVLEALRTQVTMTPTDQTREIRGWPTRLYRIEMKAPQVSVISETWTTTAAPIDEQLYRDLMNAMLSIHPRTQGMAAELAKISGITVRDEQRISSLGEEMISIRELIEVREATPPSGIYAPPAGYRETPFNPAMLR